MEKTKEIPLVLQILVGGVCMITVLIGGFMVHFTLLGFLVGALPIAGILVIDRATGSTMSHSERSGVIIGLVIWFLIPALGITFLGFAPQG